MCKGVKLEESEIISFKHAIEAIKRYTLKQEKSTDHPLRREDQSEKSYDIYSDLYAILNSNYSGNVDNLKNDFKKFCLSKYTVKKNNNKNTFTKKLSRKLSRTFSHKLSTGSYQKLTNNKYNNALETGKITPKNIDDAIALINTILSEKTNTSNRKSINSGVSSKGNSHYSARPNSPIPSNSHNSPNSKRNSRITIEKVLLYLFVQNNYKLFQKYLHQNADKMFMYYLATELQLEILTETLHTKQDFYNENIRSSNEIFIPYEITQKIIGKIIEENDTKPKANTSTSNNNSQEEWQLPPM